MPIRILAFATLILSAGLSDAAETPLPPGFKVLDQKAIRKIYSDGEFDNALSKLEEFQRTAESFPREDSLFLYKDLGVIYSHPKETREKGQAYFFKLLRMDPQASIVDMYASGSVKDVFEDARQEVNASAFLGSGFKPLRGQPAPETGATTPVTSTPAVTPAPSVFPAPADTAAPAMPAPAKAAASNPAAKSERPEDAAQDPAVFGSPNASRTWIWAGVAAVGATGAMVGLHYFLDERSNNDRILRMQD
jgi:hypothetical protein